MIQKWVKDERFFILWFYLAIEKKEELTYGNAKKGDINPIYFE
ncbi:MAG: hypothetical protein AB1414_00180 [bacterium]